MAPVDWPTPPKNGMNGWPDGALVGVALLEVPDSPGENGPKSERPGTPGFVPLGLTA